MKKRVLLIITAVVLAICACFALAACGDKAANVLSEEGSALEYEQVDDGYRVVGLAEGCTDTKLVIPSGHSGKPVTEIGEGAFAANGGITEVVFPTTLKRIDASAFADCINLQSVSLPNGLEELGDNAFYGCEAVRTVHISGTVKKIGQAAFA